MAFDPGAVRRIAVLGPNKPFWGASLVQLPFYAALRRACPGAQVTVLSPVGQARIFTDLGLAHQVEDVSGMGVGGLMAALRRARPDLAVSLRDRSLKSTLAVALSGARLTAGYDRGPNRFLLRRTAPMDTGRYMAFRYLDVLRAAGLGGQGLAGFADLFPAEDAGLPPGRTPIVLMPGGGQPEKKWGIDRFLDLAARLRGQVADPVFVFVLGTAERDEAAAVEAGLPASERVVLMDRSPGAIIDAVGRAAVTVANDCGPSHLAQMAGAPYVGIFGAFDRHTDRRLAEWFHRRTGARSVTAPRGEDAAAVPVQAVLAAVGEVMTRR
jgi:ADP-heptose:LPS heptosyltransferase